jgi:hypothetical protein
MIKASDPNAEYQKVVRHFLTAPTLPGAEAVVTAAWSGG